jgi:sec-independent protein translocase protein TatC
VRNPFRRTPKRPVVRSVDDRMTLMDHLAELRGRIVKGLLAVAAGAVVVFVFYPQILNLLAQPYFDMCEQNPQWGCSDRFIITGPLDGFAIRMRVSGWGGLVVALPIVLWQVWRFITPGLHPKEKRYAVPFIISAVILFLAGAALAFWTLPKAIEFLVDFSGDVSPLFTPNSYINLIMVMMLAFGVGFLFPVVLVFLEIAGVLHYKQLVKFRRYAAVLIVFLAAVITPSGDPYSLAALAIPLYIFYEASILIGMVVARRRTKAAQAAAAASV